MVSNCSTIAVFIAIVVVVATVVVVVTVLIIVSAVCAHLKYLTCSL